MNLPSIGIAGNEVFDARFEGRITASTAVADLQRLSTGFSVGNSLPGKPDLPWLTVVIPRVGEGGITEWGLVALAADTITLSGIIPPAQTDIVSSDTSNPGILVPPDPIVYEADRWYPQSGVVQLAPGSIRGTAAWCVAWCPFKYNPVRRELVVIRRAVMRPMTVGTEAPPSGEPDTVVALDDIKTLMLPSLQGPGPDLQFRSPGYAGAPSWMPSSDPPLGISYVVITSQQFAGPMRSLVLWKTRRGIAAGLATVEEIAARYPAVDTAASIREYLKAAYLGGLKWVVLAGDQSVVPVRYAFAGYQTAPTDLHQYQICDLYYADLDGDWDANGNGVWGEYFGDKPDLYAEIFVGRLPFSEATEAETIVRKIINYESGPADPSYLTRELSVSADQMRDWSGGSGQQKLVADLMPAGWSHDETSMTEEPSGIDPSPAGPDAPNFTSLLAGGFGWVNYYVHGRADGFVVRSSGYLNSPLSYVLTFGSSGDGSGHLNELPATPFPGIHLSGACDQGAFDLDSPPFNPTMQKCVAERLLFTPEGGAVAFIGQSRWGWVSSSYKLTSKFYQYVGDTTIPNHIGIYQALAKVAFPGYRDLNYGNNLYGDPEMPVWQQIPKHWRVMAPTTYGSSGVPWIVEVRDANGAVAGALATVSVGDTVWSVGETDGNGAVSAALALPAASEAILTVSKPGYGITTDTIPYGIIADVGDDGTTSPKRFAFLTNVPNPFNPSTSVQFGLERPDHVTLKVFDILGRAVTTLVDADMRAGQHQVEFEGTDASGRALSSGVYFARVATRGQSKVRKMVLLR